MESSAASSPPARAPRRRSWKQRSLLIVNCIVITACFGGAGGLLIARHYGSSIGRVALDAPPTGTTIASATTDSGMVSPVDSTIPVPTGPPETFAPADPAAKNYLITGADNNSCLDPNSPYASAFGDRSGMGERSDTVMIMRVDPATQRAAVLSFPRDLWVKIAGRGSSQRINTAYVKNDPQRLIDTIYQNFGVPVDHFVQVDFCAFKTIVDAIGGVGVPFVYPARDKGSGLDVPTAGCYTFTGESGLAYVRSRYYEYQTPDGKWHKDGLSDLGRISRQQDFIRRVLSAALDKGVLSPSVARGLIKAAQQNVVVDNDLSIDTMLTLVGVLRNLKPESISTYQIEAVGAKISGNAVLLPRLGGANMKSILSIFQGKAPLAGAPEQVFETTTTTTTTTSTTTTSTTTSTTTATTTTTVRGKPTTTVKPTTTTSTTTSTTVKPTTTLAPTTTVAPPDENVKGIVPPRDQKCTV